MFPHEHNVFVATNTNWSAVLMLSEMGLGINHGYKHVQRSFVLQGGMRCVRSHEQQMCERNDLVATDIGITAVLIPSEMGLGINHGCEHVQCSFVLAARRDEMRAL